MQRIIGGKRFALLFSLFISVPLFAKSLIPDSGKREILRGPLVMSADETVSTERGKIIEAAGNVAMRYEMDSGDIIESFSRFAKYDEKADSGELWGDPKAVWKRTAMGQPETTLTAEKIALKIKNSELHATGHVSVIQGSSTLKAQEVVFYNNEKKLSAAGGRPEFRIEEAAQHTVISAENIVAWMEKKEIKFMEKVRGVVYLRPQR